jgi:hypothetical protein
LLIREVLERMQNGQASFTPSFAASNCIKFGAGMQL